MTSGVLYLLVVAGAVFCTGCTKKSISHEIKIIIGGDTLTSSTVKALDPSGETDSARMFHCGVRTLLAHKGHRSSTDTLLPLFQERLLLVSDVEWTPEGARLLLMAAQGLDFTGDSADECERVKLLADSLLQILKKCPSEGVTIAADSLWGSCDLSSEVRSKKQLYLLATVLGIKDEIARLCYEFVGKQSVPLVRTDTVQTKKLVAGLLFSGETNPPPSEGSTSKVSNSQITKKKSVVLPSSNTRALTYRTEVSIRDTITKHIPFLKQLYKKSLKINSSMAGTVIVTLTVSPDGSVVSAVVKSTGIRTEAFLDDLCAYLRTVRFKSIPGNAGVMIFDFPFEFNAEM